MAIVRGIKKRFDLQLSWYRTGQLLLRSQNTQTRVVDPENLVGWNKMDWSAVPNFTV